MAENVSSLEERLAQLRPRLIVAFAVRCARRVQPRLIMNFDHWGNDELRAIISQVDSGLSNLEIWCNYGHQLSSISKEASSLFDSAARLKTATEKADADRVAHTIATITAVARTAAAVVTDVAAAAAAVAAAAPESTNAADRDINVLEKTLSLWASPRSMGAGLRI